MKTYLLLLVALLVACQPVEPVVQREVVSVPATAAFNIGSAPVEKQESVKEFNVEAFQFGFEPSELRVKEGDTVRINLKTRDVAHSLKIAEFGFVVNAAPEKEGTGEFVVTQKGEFRFYCSTPCGSGHKGMEGKLVVE